MPSFRDSKYRKAVLFVNRTFSIIPHSESSEDSIFLHCSARDVDIWEVILLKGTFGASTKGFASKDAGTVKVLGSGVGGGSSSGSRQLLRSAHLLQRMTFLLVGRTEERFTSRHELTETVAPIPIVLPFV